MADKMTIAMPTPSFLPGLGGMEVGLHNIARRLSERGHDVHVIVPASQYKTLHAQKFDAPYNIHALPMKAISLAAQAPAAAMPVLSGFFRYFSWRVPVDVWHCTMAWPLGVALARLSHLPKFKAVMMRSAGADIQVDVSIDYGVRQNPVIDRLVRAWIPELPALVAITDTVAEEYKALGVPNSRIRNIPNGVDVARFAKAQPIGGFRAMHGLKNDCFLFLGVARNHPKKNFAALIPAVKILAQTHKNFAVVLAGRDMEALRPEMLASGVAEYFVLLDAIAPPALNHDFDLPAQALLDLYKTADCFLFPSLIETFGIAIVEAMAAGLPVLTADAPGCRDIAGQGRYARLFDPARPEAIADAMGHALGNAEWRGKMRQQSLERAAMFDWDKIVSGYEALYSDLLRRA